MEKGFSEFTQVTEAIPTKQEVSYIIGIGCSAGGLKALQDFFDACPDTTGYAFVVIQHLSPDHKSLMSELLSKHTKMVVHEVIGEDKIKPNCVYLIPPSKNIIVQDQKLWLISRSKRSQVNFSVDVFFNSLAIEQREKAIGIILSGTGSDGTHGAMAVKKAGGILFIQSPESSRFDGMPISAISNGINDYILKPEEMPNKLISYIENFQSGETQSTIDEMDENAINDILEILKKDIDHDFFSYKKTTLSRRISKRMNMTKNQSIQNYINYLEKNTEEKNTLVDEFLIGVTSFFRDTEAYKIIEQKVVPDLIQKNSNESTIIKIWVIASSTGEEAYSIAILFEEYLRAQNNTTTQYKIFATDIDQKAIDIASKGIYPAKTDHISQQRLDRYFIKKGNDYYINPHIRQKIIFSRHDILHNPPFNKMDFISCRNMLIYMENNIQHKILSTIHYSLNQDGYLFLGSSESLGPLSDFFEKTDAKWKIYKKLYANTDTPKKSTKIKDWKIQQTSFEVFKSKRIQQTFEKKVEQSINHTLMNELGAASICINNNFDIIHAFGEVKTYLHFPEEGFSNNLLKMLPNEFRIPIISSTRKITTDASRIVEKQIRFVSKKNTIKIITIVIRSIKIDSVNHLSFLITFLKGIERKITKEEKDISTLNSFIEKNDIRELELALNETKHELQASIEELEVSNEEMQTTNEELLAANEELQSTNEELQSVNEELHAVNGELQEKNNLLIELNSDMENLVNNINIGTIFLDKEFRIRKFTPSINEHFQLRIEDIGRPISHFSGTLGGENLTEYSKNVIKTLQPYKKEVQNATGIWFMMEIFPYKYHKNNIQGVVVNFINIHNIKTVYDKEKLNDFLTHVMNANPAIIYIYDILKSEYIYSSGELLKGAGYTSIDIQKMGPKLFQKIVHPDDYPIVLNHFKKLKKIKKEEVLQIEYRVKHKSKNSYIWVLSTDKLNEIDSSGKVKNILGVINIITKTKDMELQLKESQERYRLAIMGSGAGLWEWSNVTTDKAWWSNEFQKLLGYYSNKRLSSFTSFTNLIHPDQLIDFREKIQNHIKETESFEHEIQIKTNKNEYRWFLISAQAQFDSKKNIRKIVGTLMDINARKEAENKMNELNTELERFAYLASHDLKEPLRTISSFTKLFREEYYQDFDANANQYLEFIENASRRMITLTDDLLIYSQLDNKSLNFQPVDLNILLSEILEDLRQHIKEKNAVIKYPNLPVIVCDMVQIRQLFQNLISNSLKYQDNKNPQIDIDFETKRTHYQFYIKDNGIGIETKHHKKIFEVFKRLHGQNDYDGTGIGLANCKRIVDNHKGNIWVKSSLGKGATFYFTLLKNNST